MAHEYFQLPYWSRTKPWLTISDPLKISRVIVARCTRYHNPLVRWQQIVAKYRKHQPTFVGLPEEHRDLQRIVGPLAYYPTPDYMTVLSVKNQRSGG